MDPTTITLNSVSAVSGNSLVKINDEIIKVKLVGVGSTNTLTVNRGAMGTVAAHTAEPQLHYFLVIIEFVMVKYISMILLMVQQELELLLQDQYFQVEHIID